jgi:hypothetical protein
MKDASKKSFDPNAASEEDKNRDLKIQYWRADVDTSDFQPSTIDFLEAVGNLFSSKNWSEILEKLADPTSPFKQESDNKIFLNDVLDMRNEHLIGEMKNALQRTNVVIVPWGALHMPVFEQKLKDWGFKETHRTRRIAFSFQKTALAQTSVQP